MKKALAFFLAITLLIGVLSGCGSKSAAAETTAAATTAAAAASTAAATTAASGKQVTLTLMETQPAEAKSAILKKMVDAFMAENPDIKVEIISTPNDQAAEKLFNLAAAGQLPDVIEMNDSWLAPLAGSGNLEDLGPYVDKWSEKSNIVDAAYSLGKVMNNTLYYLPYGLWGTAVYYNTEMLKATGMQAPVSTDDFYQVAKAMTDAGNNKYGYAMRGGMYGPTHAIMWMLSEVGSPNIIDPDTGKCVFDSPKAIEGLKKYAALFQDGCASPDSISWAFRECVEAFTTGSAGMLIQSNEVVQICNEKMGEGKFDTTMLPVGSSGKAYDTSGQTGYAMSAKSANKEAAWKLFSYLMDPVASRDFIVSMGFTPINKKLADDPAFSKGPGKVYLQQVMSGNIQFSNNPSYLTEWGDIVGATGTEQIQKMLLGQQTPEETAQNLASMLNEAEAAYRAEKK